MLALLAASPAFVARPLPHQRIAAPRHSACVAAAKGDFYDFSAKELVTNDDVDLSTFAGKVSLVVNVASA